MTSDCTLCRRPAVNPTYGTLRQGARDVRVRLCHVDGRDCFTLYTTYKYRSPEEVNEAIEAGADFVRDNYWRDGWDGGGVLAGGSSQEGDGAPTTGRQNAGQDTTEG